jgi:hypothetical protein
MKRSTSWIVSSVRFLDSQADNLIDAVHSDRTILVEERASIADASS